MTDNKMLKSADEQVLTEEQKKGIFKGSIEIVKSIFRPFYDWVDGVWNSELYLMAKMHAMGNGLRFNPPHRKELLIHVMDKCSEAQEIKRINSTLLLNIRNFSIWTRNDTEIVTHSPSMAIFLKNNPRFASSMSSAASICLIEDRQCYFHDDNGNKYIYEEYATTDITGGTLYVGIMVNGDQYIKKEI